MSEVRGDDINDMPFTTLLSAQISGKRQSGGPQFDTALAKILALPMELLAWELRRPNAVTWELQSFGPPGLQS